MAYLAYAVIRPWVGLSDYMMIRTTTRGAGG